MRLTSLQSKAQLVVRFLINTHPEMFLCIHSSYIYMMNISYFWFPVNLELSFEIRMLRNFINTNRVHLYVWLIFLFFPKNDSVQMSLSSELNVWTCLFLWNKSTVCVGILMNRVYTSLCKAYAKHSTNGTRFPIVFCIVMWFKWGINRALNPGNGIREMFERNEIYFCFYGDVV